MVGADRLRFVVADGREVNQVINNQVKETKLSYRLCRQLTSERKLEL